MARDMKKFTTAFAKVIFQSAPHIYLSALPFAPRNSVIFKHYTGLYPKTLSIQDGGETEWPPIQDVLIGHTHSVNTVLFSPDEKWVISGSDDGTIRRWDTETGKAVGTPFIGHDNSIQLVSLSPDGKNLISGALDGVIRIWDVATGSQVGEPLEGDDAGITCVLFSPDGKNIASGSVNGMVFLWATETRRIIATSSRAHVGPVSALVFSSEGGYVASGDVSEIHLWDVWTGEVTDIQPHQSVIHLDFSPDGRNLISVIRVWNIETKRNVMQ